MTTSRKIKAQKQEEAEMANETYSWASGMRSGKLKAEVAAKEFARIEGKYGHLSSAVVVEEAKDELSPLHSAFDWDDASAAAKYRHRQAGDLIRNIVVSRPDMEPTQLYVNVRSSGNPTEMGEYVPIRTLVHYPDKLEIAMNDARAALVQARTRLDALLALQPESPKVQRAVRSVARAEKDLIAATA
jgi:hypothetical protein